MGQARERRGTRRLGVAVIGCGVIGGHRARVAAGHPAVQSLVLCDLVPEKARALAEACGTEVWLTDSRAAVDRPDVDAVFVSSGEGDHFGPTMEAIRAGKHVLVEKPFVLDLDEGARLVAAAEAAGVDLFVGYTQRFRRRYLGAMEQARAGRLGELTSVFGKIYVTRAVAEAVMRRATRTSPSLNTLTYVADLVLWFLEPRRPVALFARGSRGAIWERYGVPDSTWAVMEFEGGAVATIGVSWELPAFHPAAVATMELELFGRRGVLSIEDAHRDVLLVTEQPVPSPYTPDVTARVHLLGSAMPGDWSLGRLSGPMREETSAFLDRVAGGSADPVLPDGRHGLRVLGLTLAIDESVRSGRPVDLDRALI
jgi:myo-inositol 2-dehydrogenase/D-chiro-inositol 1-dehydrogenase